MRHAPRNIPPFAGICVGDWPDRRTLSLLMISRRGIRLTLIWHATLAFLLISRLRSQGGSGHCRVQGASHDMYMRREECYEIREYIRKLVAEWTQRRFIPFAWLGLSSNQEPGTGHHSICSQVFIKAIETFGIVMLNFQHLGVYSTR